MDPELDAIVVSGILRRQKEALGASASPGSGAGWRWTEESRMLDILLEVDGLGHDDDGFPCPVGFKMSVGPCGETPTLKDVESILDAIRRQGVEIPGVNGRCGATPITWEKYVAEGYDKD